MTALTAARIAFRGTLVRCLLVMIVLSFGFIFRKVYLGDPLSLFLQGR